MIHGDGEDMDGWRSAELETVEHEDETYRVIAGLTGQIESVERDGEWIHAYEAEDEDGPVSDMLRENYGEIDSAEGPMMNYWYLIERDVDKLLQVLGTNGGDIVGKGRHARVNLLLLFQLELRELLELFLGGLFAGAGGVFPFVYVDACPLCDNMLADAQV